MDEAARCDQLLLLREGRLVAAEPPDEPPRAHGRAEPRGGVPRARRGGGAGMSLRATLATAARVLRQLGRDRRTLALVYVVPPALLTLFKYVFIDQPATFDRVGGPLVGIFPFTSMFLVTSITMLRERTTGTLERLLTLPLCEARHPRRLRDRVRRSSPTLQALAHLGRRVRPARARRRGPGLARRRARGLQRRPRDGARALRERLRARRSSRRCSSCRRSSSRSCSSAGCSCRATEMAPAPRARLDGAAADVGLRRARARGAPASSVPPRAWTSPSSLGAAALALALGAATLRRRTA